MKRIFVNLVLIILSTTCITAQKYLLIKDYYNENKKDSLSLVQIKDSFNDLNDKYKGLNDKINLIDTRIDSKFNNYNTFYGTIFTIFTILFTLILAFSVFTSVANDFQRRKIIKFKEDFEEAKVIKENIERIEENISKNLDDVTKSSGEILTKKNEILSEIDRLKDKLRKHLNNHNEEFKIKTTEAYHSKMKELFDEVDKYKSLLKIESIKQQEELDKLKINLEQNRYLISKYNDACEELEDGNVDKALLQFEEILEIDPTFYLAKAKIPMCHSALNNNDIAEGRVMEIMNQLQNINEIDHRSLQDAISETLASYGTILRRKEKFDHAITKYESNIEFKDNRIVKQIRKSTFSHLGYCYLYKKNYERATEYFQYAINSDNTSPGYYGIVKVKYLKNEDFKLELKAALAVSKKDLLINPNYIYHRFGLAFLKSVDKSILIEEFEEYFTSIIKDCKNLGILQEQLKEYKMFQDINTSDKFEFAIDEISKRINTIVTIYTDYEALSKTINV